MSLGIKFIVLRPEAFTPGQNSRENTELNACFHPGYEFQMIETRISPLSPPLFSGGNLLKSCKMLK